MRRFVELHSCPYKLVLTSSAPSGPGRSVERECAINTSPGCGNLAVDEAAAASGARSDRRTVTRIELPPTEKPEEWLDAATWPPVADPEHSVNAAFPWNKFDPLSYQRHHYEHLVEDDRRILDLAGQFLATRTREEPRRGIDMGAGSNLYPALAMLPLCEELTLMDLSTPNADWLRTEIKDYAPSWDPFWEVLAQHEPYRTFPEDPRHALRDRTRVRQGDIFQTDPGEQWDIGTMFFVAESISMVGVEFAKAVGAFLGCLRPGSPFVTAFMAGSQGYEVAGRRFPAVPIDEHHVGGVLRHYGVEDPSLYRIGIHEQLRPGYDGMILAMGQVSG
ncbi:SCO2525 family SAM-dependent methyltransferase [Longispora sp. NPDC051575]|uniref:SCO2525 family SAM-dependent methyltransferase n=1 Tax=Longispora sp. NPDC051575 TaxID=3154943 RepID=UPI00341B0E3C